MSKTVTLAHFDHEHDVLHAAAELRERGVDVLDVYSPHAIHGMDEALGLRQSRLTWVCFICGVVGAVGALWLQNWANAIDWPINVGGKPWFSMPAEVPVAFEVMVLLAAFGSVLACFAVCRLFPGRSSHSVVRNVTNDNYVIAISAAASVAEGQKLNDLLNSLHAQSVERHVFN